MGFPWGKPREKDRLKWGVPKLNSIDNQGSGRGGQVRTADLLVPNQARYRCATPRGKSPAWRVGWYPRGDSNSRT